MFAAMGGIGIVSIIVVVLVVLGVAPMTELDPEDADEETATCHMCGQIFPTQVARSQHLWMTTTRKVYRRHAPTNPDTELPDTSNAPADGDSGGRR